MKKTDMIRVLLAALLCCLLFGVFALAAFAGEDETHTVSFLLDEGVPYEGQDQEIADGGFAVVPPTPEKENAVFLRWTLEGGERFSFRTPITGDLELFAEWIPLGEGTVLTQIYTVEFQVDGETVSRQSVEAGQSAIAPTGFACPTGKTFVSWNADFTDVQGDLIVEANLTDTVYTVTVVGLDDEVIDVQQITHGGDADLSDLPAIPHYSIDGERPFEGVTEGITADGEIRVNYLPDVYRVRFFSEGEPFGDPQAVAYGEGVAFPEIPAKEHYVFIGWYLDPTDTAMFDFNTPIGEDADLYAKFIPIENPKYTVTFLNYDGTRYGGEQKIEAGHTAFVPGAPARDGYDFVGWCDENGGAFDFATPIESDRTITASFRVRAFTVTVLDGNEVISVQSVRYGENAEEPAIPEKEGAIFVGFDGSFNDIRQDTVIRARYIAKTFSVMFFDAQQRKIGGTQYIEYGGAATAPRIAPPEGYSFVGWSDDFDEVKEDLVLFPVFERLSYTVRFFDENDLLAAETVLYGDNATSPAPTRDGCIFVGWYDANEAAYDLSSPVTGDLDLYAAWQEKPPVVHTVVFTVDGATYQTQTVAHGAAAQNPANPAKYGYTFTGWDADFSNVTDDLTVAALFEIKTYTVVYTANGAVFSSEEVDHGGLATPPDATPEREGYRFVRWSFDFGTPITEDVTVKAVFAIETYAVRFFNGEEVFAEQTVEYGDFAAVPGTPQKVGATFAGWYYEDGTAFRFSHAIEGALDLYARFETLTFAVSFYDGNELFWQADVEYGETVDVPHGEPDKPGYVFVGWDFDFETPIVRETTVYAKFEQIVYTVTFTVDGKIWASATVPEGETVSAPQQPRKDGYRFVGWEWDFRDPVNGNETVEALFERITYTVTYTANGAFLYADVVGWGDLAEEPDPVSVDGYVFVGWDFDFDTPIKADTTVAAILERVTHTVTFKVRNAVYATASVGEGEFAEAPGTAPAIEGMAFVGWDFDFGTPITEDVTVEAIFRYIDYTVSYYVDGTLYYEQTYHAGDEIVAPGAPELVGLIFNGWADLPAVMPARDLVIEGDVTVLPDNLFTLDRTDNPDGTTTLSLRVSGNVRIAGLIGRLSTEATSLTPEAILAANSEEADVVARVYVTSDGEIRFIWTAAENATEDFTVFTLTYKAGVEAPDFTLEIEEARVINEQDEIVDAAYTFD